MTYLPQLHRILVEGAARLEGEQSNLNSRLVSRRERSARRLASALRKIRHRRLFIFIGVALLAAGSATAAVVVLNARSSAPSHGSLRSQTGVGTAVQSVTGSYTVGVTPDLLGGSVGLCINEQDRESVAVPVGNVAALRAALVAQRTRLARLLAGPSGSLTEQVRATWAHELNAVIPQLLGELAAPARVRESQAFQDAYRGLLGSSTGGASGCGLVSQLGSSVVADLGQSDRSRARAATSTTTTTLVLVTTSGVAAVRVSPTLTLLTRSDKGLPDGWRIAIAVQQTLGANTSLPIGPGAPRPLPLDAEGRQLPVSVSSVKPSEPAVSWQRPAMRGARALAEASKPPPGPCEINISALGNLTLALGEVVEHVKALPQLAARTFLSCASTDFVSGGRFVRAAILIDAQHPGALPEALPGAMRVARDGKVFSEITASAGGTQSITARRIGDAWLAVQSPGPLQQQLSILEHLGACVRLSGRCS